MDKLAKALRKLSAGERAAVRKILGQVVAQQVDNLDVKKLKGHRDIFRVRKGHLRIIYRIAPDGNTYILAIERRSESTYRAF